MNIDGQAKYETLDEIVQVLDTEFSDLTWVGKNYSKAALVRDLKNLKKISLLDKVKLFVGGFFS